MHEEYNELESHEHADHSHGSEHVHHIKSVSGLYKNWFLDYASYVILERAVPHIIDGLKPVQRRILHSMKRLDDGRFNKVANVIGYTMQYHPHGDASIGDALVQLGQKDLFVETQGNWGNILTGDGAAAPRYIEARLSKLALDVVFNPKTTNWKLSYDGRNKEPINLPMKFPALLAQGVEGIAVGLASKILPHNFNELLDASIKYLKNESFIIYPDFPTGGMVDVSRYNDGLRGGKIRIRAKIDKLDKKTLIITEIPFGQTTGTLIESILAANEKGKIKIKKIEDKTAAKVQILIHLAPEISPDVTIDALYAFTGCELSVSPNACVIDNEKPRFVTVSEILKISTDNTLNLLKEELLIRRSELEDDWHLSSLEKIFIENRLYLLIEECETWEAIIETIDKGLDPFKPLLRREVVYDDIVRLTEIKIKRISKYNAFEAEEHIRGVEEEMKKIDYNLAHIVDYTIAFFQRIKDKYGKDRQRKTEIRSFDNIVAAEVVVANEKLYINRADGFAGTGLKKDEYVCDCSDIDDIIVFRSDGTYSIVKVADKFFIGTNAIYINVFRKNDERTIYNVAYRDGKTGFTFVKRFYVKGITRDKTYDLTQGNPNSVIQYFSANPNGESEIVRVMLKPRPRLKKRVFDFDFGDMGVKARTSIGNTLSRNPVHKIVMLQKGDSTLGGQKFWFENETGRLNIDQRGKFLGEFKDDDKLVYVTSSGMFKVTSLDVSQHFDIDLVVVEKLSKDKVYTLIFYNGEQKAHYMKRFTFEEIDRETSLIGEHPESKFVAISGNEEVKIVLKYNNSRGKRANDEIDAEGFVTVRSFRAQGKRLSNYDVSEGELIAPEVFVQQDIFATAKDDIKADEKTDFDGTLKFPEPEFEIVRPDGHEDDTDLDEDSDN